MNRIVNILNQSKPFFLATNDEMQPRVRPYNAVMEYDDKVYFYTNTRTHAFKQIENNPNVEICAMINEDRWLRVSGKVVYDDNTDAKLAMLEANPELRSMYNENDKIFKVFYLDNMQATIHSVHSESEIIK